MSEEFYGYFERFERVRTRRFELVDDEGNVRAILSASPRGREVIVGLHFVGPGDNIELI